MKKTLALFAAMIALTGCTDYSAQEERQAGECAPYHIFVENVRGHDYVVFFSQIGYGLGISAIHSEACKCKSDTLLRDID